MLHKQFIYCWQKWLSTILVPAAVKVVVTICLTAGMLGILGSVAPVSNAQAVFPTFVANITRFKPTTLNATVYHSPECNCCGGWIDHLKAQGFQITDFSTSDI